MSWAALIAAAVQIVPQITGKMEADRVARYNSRQHKLDTGVAVQDDLEQSSRAIGRAATLAAASGGGLTGSALAVIEDLSRQAMYRARSTAYTGVSQSEDLARQTIPRGAVTGGAIRAATPLFQSWASSGGGFGGQSPAARGVKKGSGGFMSGVSGARGG